MNNKKITALTLATLMSSLALVGCNNAQKDLAAEILQKLIIDGDTYKQVVGDFTVASEITHNGKTYGITWTENSDLMEVKVDGKKVTIDVTRPAVGEKNESYELTATIDVDGYEASKTFKGLLIAEEPVPEYTDASDLFADIASHKISPLQKPVKFTGVVTRTYGSGFYVTDADGHSIYTYSSPDGLKIGDKVELTGKFDAYYSMYQFKKPSVKVIASNQTVPELNVYNEKALTATELNALKVGKGDLIHGSIVNAKGIVHDDGYGVALLDPADLSKSIVLYSSNLDKEVKKEILKQEGKLVEFKTVYYTNHDKDGNVEPYLSYDDNAETIPAGVALDAETQFAFSTFVYKLPDVVASDLPSEIKVNNDVKYKVTYEADKVNDKLWIDANGKVKEIPEKAVKIPNVKVTIAHPTDKSKNVIKEYKDVNVGIDKITKVSDIMAEADKSKTYFVKGVVVGTPYENDYLIAEGDEIYYVRGYGIADKMVIGNEVTLYGKYSYYNGANQFAPKQVVASKASTAPTYDFTKAIEIDTAKVKEVADKNLTEDESKKDADVQALLANCWKLVKFNGEVKESGGVKYVKAPGFFKAKVEVPEEINVGDKVTFYGTVVGANIFQGKFNGLTAYGVKVEKIAA